MGRFDGGGHGGWQEGGMERVGRSSPSSRHKVGEVGVGGGDGG